MTGIPLLSVHNLSRSFGRGGDAAVDNVSFAIDRGEILALVGPSGCGKTTTLRMIAGFEAPDEGRVQLSGRDVTEVAPENRGIGMVFQDYALFPHMTVQDNIMFGARKRTADNVADYLTMVGLPGYGSRYPDQLSGGQQQRVALARSLAAEPGLLLLDEPFSNLDAALRTATRYEIRRMLKASGIGIVFVTHDQEEALSFADRIAVMKNGRIQQCSTAQDVYDRPENAFVATFMGRTNLLEAMASGQMAETALGNMPLARPATGNVTLSLRPEHLSLHQAQDAGDANGRIIAAEFRGHDMTYRVECNGRELQVDAMQRRRFTEGDLVRVEISGEAVPLRNPV